MTTYLRYLVVDRTQTDSYRPMQDSGSTPPYSSLSIS